MFVRRKLIADSKISNWKNAVKYPVFYLAWKQGRVSYERFIGSELSIDKIDKALKKVPKEHKVIGKGRSKTKVKATALLLLQQFANKSVKK